LQPVHRRPEGGRSRARPQGARRSRRQRPRCVRQARRASEGISAVRLTPAERQADIFRRQADYCDTRSPFYAALCRRFATDARVAAIAPDLRWDLPLRILGGIHYLVRGGEASWDAVDDVLDTRAEFLACFARARPVQTNEVSR